MKFLLATLTIVGLGVLLITAGAGQTPAEIETEMQRADEMPIPTAPVGYSTPRKCFETYWNSFKNVDSSHFASMTPGCIARIFQKDEPLSPEGLQRITAGRAQLMERNFQLVGFKYLPAPQRPKVEFNYTLDRTIGGQTCHFNFLERVTFTSKSDGWKIDSSEQEEIE